MSGTEKHASQLRYPPELKERAVRMACQVADEEGLVERGCPAGGQAVASGVESLRGWVKQAEIDAGRRLGITTAESARIAELERENRELRPANEILKAASAFFAQGLDPRLPGNRLHQGEPGPGH